MVIALDKNKRPIGVMTERRARILMERWEACLYRRYPAVVILKHKDVRQMEGLPRYRIKIDPGSKYTGIAVVNEDTDEVVFYMQIEHRGAEIVYKLQTRANARGNRRSRETWYRRPKFDNKPHKKGSKWQMTSPRPEGWLPPSIKSIGDNVLNWTHKLGRWLNITECSFEAVRFDTQLLENPDIEGEEYQHGTLYGYELKEYLMEKCFHTCQYCGGTSGDPVLEWEHVTPRTRGGSDSVRNATLACRSCNI